MNKFISILKYVIIVLGTTIILSVFLTGCDKIECKPDARKGYFGLVCGGEF